jgi:hypothetical protein
MKNTNIIKITFTEKDYIKANKIAARNERIENGFTVRHKVHKSKKAYDRKRDKIVNF